MSGHATLEMRVERAEVVGDTLKRFRLKAADGTALPPAAAGAHVLVAMRGAGRSWRNAYSLVSPPGERAHYDIVVRRVQATRGGSRFMHDEVRAGEIVRIGTPVNLFPVSLVAHRHLLLAGGIGLTPFLSFLSHLRASGAAHELHQCCRVEDVPAFEQLLAPYAGPNVRIVAGRAGLDLPKLMDRQKLGTHLYACGPESFLDMVLGAARARGWAPGRLHTESFGHAAAGEPFTVRLARSDLVVRVDGGESLLEAIENAGVDAPCLCRGGVCGECQTGVLEGVPEHRDHVLSEADKLSGRTMMICVSRARSPTLVLDL